MGVCAGGCRVATCMRGASSPLREARYQLTSQRRELGTPSVTFDANSDVLHQPVARVVSGRRQLFVGGHGFVRGRDTQLLHHWPGTVLGVKCLVLRIHGHGKGSYANEYYDVRVAQDTDGNLRFLRVTGWEPVSGALDWIVSTPASARMLFPATVQAGQRWMMFDQQSEVMAVGQTVPQLSTGFGPTANCVHIAAVSDDGDVDQSWWGAGIGVVKEVWSDSGQLNGWERLPGIPSIFDDNSDAFTNPWPGCIRSATAIRWRARARSPARLAVGPSPAGKRCSG